MRAVLLLCALAATDARAQTLRRPVGCSGCISNFYYFDRNGTAPGREDWSCGTSTYDTHRGSDFSLAGGNDAIAGGFDVVAAADGSVVSTQDGHFDRCTTCDSATDGRCGTSFGFGYGNHVVVNHGSYRVIYAHLRTGSVRVGPGAMVRCGDVLGQIGSSGCSTGAHLHFETRPLGGASSTAFDPFAGSCSSTSPSLWTEQGPYRGLPGPACDGTPACPPGTYAIWTCNAERTHRRRCIDGSDMIEDCAYGCISMPVGTDDVCAAPPDGDGDGHAADVDCDDADPSRHPGAQERCGDGIDQDCDGSDLACPLMDAGGPDPDGGVVLDGAGVRRDAGGGGDASAPDTLRGGCGCRATVSAPTIAPWLVLLALGRRRR